MQCVFSATITPRVSHEADSEAMQPQAQTQAEAQPYEQERESASEQCQLADNPVMPVPQMVPPSTSVSASETQSECGDETESVNITLDINTVETLSIRLFGTYPEDLPTAIQAKFLWWLEQAPPQVQRLLQADTEGTEHKSSGTSPASSCAAIDSAIWCQAGT